MSDPWEKMVGEPSIWFARFATYRQMEPEARSLEAVWRAELERADEAKRSKAKRPNSSWYAASDKWNWKGRAFAWDEHQRALDDQAWALRRRQRRDAAWSIGERFLERARAMLEWPLEQRSISRDGCRITVAPLDWRAADIPKFVQMWQSLTIAALGGGEDAQAKREEFSRQLEDEFDRIVERIRSGEASLDLE